jgi:hypothetical protein
MSARRLSRHDFPAKIERLTGQGGWTEGRWRPLTPTRHRDANQQLAT